MASNCVPWKWRKAGRIGTEEAEKVRFIADLPLRLVYGLHDPLTLEV